MSSSRLLLSVLLLLLCGRAAPAALSGSEDEDVCSPERVADPFTRVIVASEGPNVLIECNVTRGHADVKWFSPQGAELGGEAGEKWRIEENGALNITAASFKDGGRYTCVTTSDAGVTKTYTVGLCVLRSLSFLDLCYVIVYHLIPWCLDLLLGLTFLYYSYKHFYIFLIGCFIIYLKDEILGPTQFIASPA